MRKWWITLVATIAATVAVAQYANPPIGPGSIVPVGPSSTTGGAACISCPNETLSFSTGSYTVGGSPVSLASEVSVSRAISSYAQTSSGSLTLFPSNSPRVTDLGLLIEGSATNLILQSENFSNSSWSKQANASITSNQNIAPNGQANSASLFTTSNAASAAVLQGITVTSGATVALSVYVAPGNISWFRLQLTDGVANAFWVYFNLSGGLVGSTNSVGTANKISASMVKSSNGFYRIIIIGSLPGQTSYNMLMTTAQADNNTNAVVGGTAYLWGAQIENSSVPTSYISTTTASVARPADVVTLTGNAQSILGAAAWSATVSTNILDATPGSTSILIDSGGGGSNKSVYAIGASTIASSSSDGTVLTTTSGPGTFTSGLVISGISVNSSGRSIVANNGTVTTDAKTFSATVNPTLGGAGTYINGFVTSLNLWNTRISDASLAANTSGSSQSQFIYDGASFPWYGTATWPHALYANSTNTTTVTWEAWDPVGKRRLARVSSFNHSTLVGSPAVTVTTLVNTNDSHGNPAIVRDYQGFIHLFADGHDNSTPTQHLVTSSADNIAAWTARPNLTTTATYPHAYSVGNALYVLIRGQTGGGQTQLVVFVTTALNNGVETWAAGKAIVDFGGSGATANVFYHGNDLVVGTDIYIFATNGLSNDTGGRQNVYAFIYSTVDGSVRNMSGSFSVSSGSQPISLSTANSNFLVVNQAISSTFGNFPGQCIDGNSVIHLVYLDGTGPNYVMNYINWNGSSWSSPISEGTATDRFVSPMLICQSDNSVELYSAQNLSPSIYGRGGNIIRRTRSAVGVWGADQVIMSSVPMSLDEPSAVVNGRQDARLIFTQITTSVIPSTGNDSDPPNSDGGSLQGWLYGSGGFIGRSNK